MTLPPNDPYSQPAPQGQWGQPSPAPQDQWGQPAPQGQWGQPSPAPQDQWTPHAQGAPAPGQAPGQAPGAQPGTDLGADLGAALSFSGRGLLRNPVAFLVSGLVYVVLMMLVIGGGFTGGFIAMFSMIESNPSSDAAVGTAMLVFYAVVFGASLLAMPIGLLWQSGAARAAGIIRDGGRPSIGQTFIGPGRVLLTALLYGLAVFVGMLLLYIPGLIAAVMFMYAVPAALRGASPVDALKESFSLAKANLGTTIIAYLVLTVVTSVASMIVIPVLVLAPFTMLFQLGMYERLSGRQLAEPAQG